MSHENPVAALEALLFIHGEPLQLKKVAAVLDLSKEALLAALEEYRAALEDGSRGLTLFIDTNLSELQSSKEWGSAKVQLATKSEFSALLSQFVKEELEEDLTPASLEALSLILYLGPIPRSRLDYLRGVNSSFIIKNLLLRGLIERIPDPERPSTFLYRASLDTLRHLGIRDTSELPEYEKFRTLTTVSDPAPEAAAEPPASGS